ncbi:MAG: MoxR family ATPase [Candidatus Eremiobacteraeota bacterium]|nr:MoxR family ATPase [Candidatus Eremiobacteraeota bacterium]
MAQELAEIKEKVEKDSIYIKNLEREIGKVIVGQEHVLERVLVGLLADGHLLLEGVPGLAKTLLFSTLARCIRAKFQRIQFTPDLLPADLTGTTIYNPQTGEFSVKKGPIFANLILADEINRAPAKVQSALLESMQERQVTIGDETEPLPVPFLVMATQNPIEQEGTYPLPEAQVDRFMLKINITYPSKEEEYRIIERMSGLEIPVAGPVIEPEDIMRLREVVREIYLDEKVKNYILDIVFATREPGKFNMPELSDLIAYGVSPRGSLYLALAAKALAFIRGRGYVTPDDIKTIGPDVMRHRIIVSYEGQAEGKTPDEILRKIFETVEVP